jgi:hypothetical protein
VSRWALPLTLGLALATTPARADEGKQECVAAHADSQRLRSEAKLTEAREKLIACTRPECPGAVRSDCAKWLGEVQDELPSVVVVATDANGGDVADVKIIVDGKVVASELNGQPVLLDPGARTLRFEREGSSPVERKLVIRVGERNRRVEVQFVPQLAGATGPGVTPGAPSDEPTHDSGTSGGGGKIPTMTWVLGGVGVLGLASFTYFSLDGLGKESDLKDCKPNCSHDDVQSTKTSYLIGDISLGVGVVALAGAAYFYFTRPAPQTASTGTGVRFDLRTGKNGAFGLVSGSF